MNSIAKKALALLLTIVGVPCVAAALTIDLHPAFEFPYTYQGQQVVAVGRDGLFLDSNHGAPAAWQGNPSMQTAFANWADPAKNFTWLDVTMEIDDHTGDATISGTMKNNANAQDLYSLSMNLSGMCVRSGANCTPKTAQPNLDLRAFLEDPAHSDNSALGTDLDYGFEWTTLGLQVTAQGANPVYTGVTDFVGWSMPPQHVNPIELHVWTNSPGPGELYLQAWYQAFNHHGKRIAVGDTKSFGKLLDEPTPPPPNEIPEPSTILLLGTAGLGLLRKRHLSKQ